MNSIKFNNQKGFTLIEMIVVIIILGILAVSAIPKYIDMQEEAERAALDGVAGALSSASAINTAAYRISSGSKGTSITSASNCTDIGALLEGGALPTGYTIVSATPPSSSCVVQTTSGTYTTNFVAYTTN